METYELKIVKTEEGVTFDEQSNMSDFEIMGVLSYLVQAHSLKLAKQLDDYDMEKSKIET